MYSQPRISPNGELLALQKEDSEEQHVWLYDLRGAAPIRRLTFGGAINTRPTWTPDGQRIVFRSDRESDGGLFWQRADGTGPAERLARAEEATTLQPEAWSPDGKQFVVMFPKSADLNKPPDEQINVTLNWFEELKARAPTE